MQGGTFHFDPVNRVLEVNGQIVVDHINSAPATDQALAQLLDKGKTMVTIEQMSTGHWNVKYTTALPEHHANVAAKADKEARSRRQQHDKALESYADQKKKAEKEAKARKRKDAGEPPEEVE